MAEEIQTFFVDLWSFANAKHSHGVYNTVCLAVLLALPLVVLFTSVVVCCHCCCCRRDNSDRSCRRRRRRHGDDPGASGAKTEKKRKKNSNSKNEDLWISVKTGPMTPDRVTLTMV